MSDTRRADVPLSSGRTLHHGRVNAGLVIRRGVARFLDFELFSIPATVIVAALRPAHAPSGYLSRGIAAVVLLVWIGGAVYEIAFVALWGQTLGKRLLAVKVVGLDTPLPGWGRSAVRWIVVGGVPFLFGNWGTAGASAISAGWFLLIVVSVLVPSDGRGLHDRAARTVVVRATAPGPPTGS